MTEPHQRFEIFEPIAVGGEGTVYRACDRTTGELVALKLLHHAASPLLERMDAEARQLRSFDDPRIAGYVDHGVLGERAYLATRWLPGETLAVRLRGGRPTIPEVLAIARGAAGALALVHRSGLVHRDVKPSNLFLCDRQPERITLLDFGIAVAPRGADALGELIARGTPNYIAPEQAWGAIAVDSRADVFSLGCVLYECLAGQPPFAAASVVATLGRVLSDDPTPPGELHDGIPPPLAELLDAMLAKSPSARPVDGDAVGAWLDAIAAGRPPPQVLAATLSEIEPEVVSIVFMPGLTPGPPIGHTFTAVATPHEARDEMVHVVTDVTILGGELGRDPSGALLVTVRSRGVQGGAERAARCALRMRETWPDRTIAIATAAAVMTLQSFPVGEVLERAAALAAGDDHGEIRLDATTACLLEGSFDLTERGGRTLLGGPRRARDEGAIPWVGRDPELARLLDRCTTVAESTVVTLVTGDAGTGKTRLAQQLVASLHAHVPGQRVWRCAGAPALQGSSLAGLAELIQGAVGVVASDPADVRRAKLRSRLDLLALGPEIATLLVYLVACHTDGRIDEDDERLRLARRDPKLIDEQLRTAWIAWMAAEAASGPMLIVLDDLHWMDAATVRYLGHMLEQSPDPAIRWLALARPEVHQRFPMLWRGAAEELALTPLTDADATRLARAILGEDVAADRIGRLVARGGGNPLALRELAWLDDLPDDDGTSRVPTIMLARLALLAPRARRVLRAASIFGEAFSAPGLAAILGGDTPSDLHDLLAAGLLHEVGAGEYRFQHATVRDAAYSLLSTRDRRDGHGRAGEWLDRAGYRDPAPLAEHWRAAGRLDRAASAYLEAARGALEAGDTAGAVGLAEHGLACGPVATGALHLVIAWASLQRSHYQLAVDASNAACAALAPGSDDWYRAISVRGWSAAEADRIDEFRATVQELVEHLDSPDRVGTTPSFALLSAVTVLVQQSMGIEGHTRVDVRLWRLLNDAEASGLVEQDPLLAAHMAGTRSVEHIFGGDSYLAYQHAIKARDLYLAIGARYYASFQANNAGDRCLRVGMFALAEEVLWSAGNKLHGLNLAELRIRTGQIGEAYRVLDAVTAVALANGDVRVVAAANAFRALALEADGRLDEAEATASAALAEMVTWPDLTAQASAQLAWLRLRRGDLAAARASSDLAMRTVEAFGAIGGGMRVWLVHIEVQHASGDEAGTRATIRDAYARLTGEAERLPPDWRASFLALEESRGIAAWAQRIGISLTAE